MRIAIGPQYEVGRKYSLAKGGEVPATAQTSGGCCEDLKHICRKRRIRYDRFIEPNDF